MSARARTPRATAIKGIAMPLWDTRFQVGGYAYKKKTGEKMFLSVVSYRTRTVEGSFPGEMNREAGALHRTKTYNMADLERAEAADPNRRPPQA